MAIYHKTLLLRALREIQRMRDKGLLKIGGRHIPGRVYILQYHRFCGM